MSLLMRFPTRRGRKAERPKHPDAEKARYVVGLLPYEGRYPNNPQPLGAVLCPTVKPPHVAGVRSGATSRFTVTPDRLHCTSVGRHGTKVGRTPRESGVRAVRTTHGQRLPTLGQWEPGARLPAERSTLR